MKNSKLKIIIQVEDETGNITEHTITEQVANTEVEGIDELEQLLLKNGYAAFRGLMEKQLENVSKKKPLVKGKE